MTTGSIDRLQSRFSIYEGVCKVDVGYDVGLIVYCPINGRPLQF